MQSIKNTLELLNILKINVSEDDPIPIVPDFKSQNGRESHSQTWFPHNAFQMQRFPQDSSDSSSHQPPLGKQKAFVFQISIDRSAFLSIYFLLNYLFSRSQTPSGQRCSLVLRSSWPLGFLAWHQTSSIAQYC